MNFMSAKIHIYFYMCKRVRMKCDTKFYLGVRNASGETVSISCLSAKQLHTG